MPANQQTQPYTLSHLQMYDECPQKYKLCFIDKFKPIERPGGVETSKTGNKMHNAINYFLKGQDVSKIIQSFNPIEQELWVNFKNSEIRNYHFLKSEYAFNVNVDGYWLTGRIDALVKDTKNDEYIIFDWKTGENFKGEFVQFQTTFYLLCLYEILKSVNYIEIPAQLSLYYVNLSTNNVIKIKLVKDMLQQFRAKIIGLANKIHNDKIYFCNKSDKCKTCKFSHACSF